MSQIIILFILLVVLPIIYFTIYFIYKYIILYIIYKYSNKLYLEYGNSWVVITGASSGIGEKLTYEFIKLGFNICLIGSKNSLKVIEKINKEKRKKGELYFIEKDFNKAYEKDFFKDIEEWINNNNVSILINNIGHRVSSINYITQSRKDIYNTIICGTIPQSILSQIALKKFLKRNKKSSIINITAQCFTYNLGLGSIWSPIISVPYLACYEASNAYGYYHSQSLLEEIKIKRKKDARYNNINLITITPGAVLTSNTINSLKWIPFSCSDTKFASNILPLISKLEGQQCAYWGHELSNILMFFAPFLRRYILSEVGYNIAINN